jgi:ankyrin repeat protein
MHIAAVKGASRILKRLIQLNADINVRDKQGRTPLMLATNAEMARQLVEAGADPEHIPYPSK